MTGLSSILALFEAALRGEDAACMTIDEAHTHAKEGRRFPAKVILNPVDKTDAHGRVTLQGIDFGALTTVVLSAHTVELENVKAEKFVQHAPLGLFGAHHPPGTLSARHCTLDAIETRGVTDIRTVGNHGAMDVTAKGVKDLYLESNSQQTGLHIDLVEGLQVVIAGENSLCNNVQLDFMAVTLDGRTETMISNGKQFCLHKMNADRPGIRHLIEGRIDLRRDMIRAAHDENRPGAADLEAREAPHVAEYAAIIATLDAYAGKSPVAGHAFAARGHRPQGR